MHRSFWKTFVQVAGAHVAILALMALVSSLRFWFMPKSDEITIPIDFIVALPSVEAVAMEMEAPVPKPDPVPEPEPIPEPDPVPEPDPQPPPPEPPARPPRQPIETSRQRVTRTVQPPQPPQPARPALSPAEIERMLAAGARIGERTVIPDEDQRVLGRIRDLLHANWNQPSAAAAGGREAILSLTLDSQGRVLSGDLTRPSGSDALDASVRDVLTRVHVIPGITPDFVRRYPQVHVAFQVR